MPGLLDLEDHFPPEKVEAVYAALTVEDVQCTEAVTPLGQRQIVATFAAELRRRGFVVTAFPPADLRAAAIQLCEAFPPGPGGTARGDAIEAVRAALEQVGGSFL